MRLSLLMLLAAVAAGCGGHSSAATYFPDRMEIPAPSPD